jgi:hypothetical protein
MRLTPQTLAGYSCLAYKDTSNFWTRSSEFRAQRAAVFGREGSGELSGEARP